MDHQAHVFQSSENLKSGQQLMLSTLSERIYHQTTMARTDWARKNQHSATLSDIQFDVHFAMQLSSPTRAFLQFFWTQRYRPGPFLEMLF